jgi:GntR family transcriptional regulator/MocR family aminotransferase
LAKQDDATTFLLIERRFDRSADSPLFRQLYELLRHLIVERELRSGTKLPSTRGLAEGLGVSRHTVSTAVEQLLSEGYLVGHRGSGTYVSRHFTPRREDRQAPGRTVPAAAALSRRGDALVSSRRSPFSRDPVPTAAGRAFQVGLPAVDHFPAAGWARVLNGAWKEASARYLGYQHPLGYEPLRASIASYLRASRGLSCRPEQVVVVAGSQSALELSFRLLIDPHDSVALEDPGYLGARAAATAAGALTVPVPVDREGLDVDALESLAVAPRVVFVTPTHQFPLGVTMSLRRRIALAIWAERSGAWILEDDYDSEYRYGGRPFDPLAVLDRAGRVIYIGTFSKTLFPALRLGYLVVPVGLVDPFEAARLSADIHRPMVEQVALARFMAEGRFAQHLRRTREVHAERRAALLEESRRLLGGLLDVEPAAAGLHLVGRLPDGTDDSAVAAAAARRGVDVWPLSLHALADARRGLLLGYGGVPPPLIRRGVEQLARAICEPAGRPAPRPELPAPGVPELRHIRSGGAALHRDVAGQPPTDVFDQVAFDDLAPSRHGRGNDDHMAGAPGPGHGDDGLDRAPGGGDLAPRPGAGLLQPSDRAPDRVRVISHFPPRRQQAGVGQPEGRAVDPGQGHDRHRFAAAAGDGLRDNRHRDRLTCGDDQDRRRLSRLVAEPAPAQPAGDRTERATDLAGHCAGGCVHSSSPLTGP